MIKKLILLILLFQFQTSFSQKRKSVILDTLKFKSKKCETCPVENNILIYKLLKCGLYEGNNKDIAFKSARLKSDFESEKSFISSIWGVNKKDSINGGIVEMKNVIDTKSFKFLNYSYWKDKKNVYYYFANSDGGSVSIVDFADSRTIQIFDDTRYAKDNVNVYYSGIKINNADTKTFKIFKNGVHSDFGFDKLNFYESERVLTENEVKEYKLKRE